MKLDPDTVDAAHRHFAAEAFNRCWELIEKQDRSRPEELEMIRRAEVSFWHWQAVEGRSPTHDAVGRWQLARVHALAGDPAVAIHHAEVGLAVVRAAGLDAFYEAYAWESLARACVRAGDGRRAGEALAEARRRVEGIGNADHRSAVEADLASIALP